jgi:hypothetical protein
MRVFVSYSSKDRAAVQALVSALQERGIECWWDQWDIDAGTDIVAAINKGLDEADAGIIVFSDHSKESRWVEAESSYLTYARIQESKVLIPVIAFGIRRSFNSGQNFIRSRFTKDLYILSKRM